MLIKTGLSGYLFNYIFQAKYPPMVLHRRCLAYTNETILLPIQIEPVEAVGIEASDVQGL